ncbi:MAG TPA: hypothetical protein VEZ16_04530 [Microvirga sp.]|nr:hypothetical protein [Microvirga sp.]
MLSKRIHALAIAAVLAAGATGVAFAQAGAPSGGGKASPGIDTGASGTDKFPLRERAEPNATGAVGSPAVNPPGNPVGTIDPNPNAAAESGASGTSPCFPGQSGQQVGNVNPSGAASQCR